MRALGDAGVDLKVASRDGVTALQAATLEGHRSVVDVLAEFGITPSLVAPVARHWKQVVAQSAAGAEAGPGAAPLAKPAQAPQP